MKDRARSAQLGLVPEVNAGERSQAATTVRSGGAFVASILR